MAELEIQAEGTREEADSLGRVRVPQARLWGAQTQRALAHFAISSERMPPEFLTALARVKRAAAQVHRRTGGLEHRVADAIMAAADEVIAGRHWEEFPLAVWQTGSATQTHMNMNEVLANRASELLGGGRGLGRLVHPNDHVNKSQSSNDVIPSALHIAALEGLHRRLLPALHQLRTSLAAQAGAWRQLVKIGRTHLQDATPLTLGQEFSGYVAQLDHALRHLQASLPHLRELAIGGTAVGTGLNAPPGFGEQMASQLAQDSGFPLGSAPNKFEALATVDALVQAHAALRGLAVALAKIANDIRWMASGPRCGLGELRLPENEPGSSIMPGKVNPTQCEAVLMICWQVMANDLAVGLAGAAGSNFELNTGQPLVIQSVLQSIRLLGDGMVSLDLHCVRSLEPDQQRLAELVSRSLMLVTALSPHLGYDRASEIARKAHAEGSSLREAALALGYLSPQEFDTWVQPARMV
jgi:fumarate hydratase class II